MSDDYRLFVRATGGPEAIERESIMLGAPGPGEALVRHKAIGLNLIDTYHRTGLYPLALPGCLGVEAAGVVEAVGPGVGGVKPGDRVGYTSAKPGTYCSARIMPADRLVPLPDAIADDVAAASLLKGMTTEFLVRRCAKVQPGQTVLVHSAAGGVGMLLVSWLKAIGAKVIAHAGSAEKAAIASANGADIALSCPFDELAGRVRAETEGRGVSVSFDGVGAASWKASLASIARRGLMVSYGNASGPVPPIAMLELTQAGSLFATRPTMFDYIAEREELLDSAGALFSMIEAGTLSIKIGQRFALSDAADAHRAIESRRTTGSTILLP